MISLIADFHCDHWPTVSSVRIRGRIPGHLRLASIIKAFSYRLREAACLLMEFHLRKLGEKVIGIIAEYQVKLIGVWGLTG